MNSTSAPASRYIRARSRARSRPSTARASVRAMITNSGWVRASTAARTFAAISSAGNDELALHVPALLRGHLVLDVDPGDPGRLVGADGADHVQRVAVAGVGVGDHRDVHAGRDPPRACRPSRSSSAGRRPAARSAPPRSRTRSCTRPGTRPPPPAGPPADRTPPAPRWSGRTPAAHAAGPPRRAAASAAPSPDVPGQPPGRTRSTHPGHPRPPGVSCSRWWSRSLRRRSSCPRGAFWCRR